MKNSAKNKKAFTLIEVLVVSLIGGIVGLGVVMAIANSNKLLNNSFTQTMSETNMRHLMNDIGRDVMQGVALSVPWDWSNKLTINKHDGTMIVWESIFKPEKFGYVMTRTAPDGSKKEYIMFGAKENSWNDYKYMYTQFRVNIDEISGGTATGPYHKVWMRVLYYEGNSGNNFSNWQTENTFYCRNQAAVYGF
jgi:prepilin-type N-terminal cleavage/methylation domain-containing protein